MSRVRILTLTYIILPLLSFAASAHAADFVPLIPIPGITDANPNIGSYVDTLYVVAIGVAGLIAVGRLIYAGLRLIFSQIVTERVSAKKDMQSAALGLLIVLSAVTIMTTINPSLGILPSLRDAPPPTGGPPELTAEPVVTDSKIDGAGTAGDGLISQENLSALRASCNGRLVTRNDGSWQCFATSDNDHQINTDDRLTNTLDQVGISDPTERETYTRRYYENASSQSLPEYVTDEVIRSALEEEFSTELDYVFAVPIIDPFALGNSPAGVMKQQQQFLCDDLTGVFVDMQNAGYRVCVISN